MMDGQRKSMAVKVSLDVVPDNVAHDGEPNRIIRCAKLTHAAAQRIVDETPGAYIEKVIADKD